MKCVQLEKTQSELQDANEMIMSLSMQLRQIRVAILAEFKFH